MKEYPISKSFDWFLYDRDLHHEGIKQNHEPNRNFQNFDLECTSQPISQSLTQNICI